MAALRPHGKAALDPAEYEFVEAGDAEASRALAATPPFGFVTPESMRLWAEAVRATREYEARLRALVRPNSLHKCTHCGAAIRYFNIWRHVPTGEHIVTGNDCAEERMILDSRAALAASLVQKAAASRAAAAKLSADAHRWIAEHEDLWTRMLAARGDSFVGQMVEAVAKYGSLTDRQLAALVEKVLPRIAGWMEPGAVCELREKVPAPEGTLTVRGEVRTVRVQDGDYGAQVKMLVDCGAYRVWSTVPASLPDDLVGKTVEFVATLKRSERDVDFAFASRPRKAKVVEA